MNTFEYELPFRWNIQQRANLGTLLEGPHEDIPKEGPDPSSLPPGQPPYYPADVLSEITAECARIIAFCDNADLCFVGRSLENLFDYLSGLLIDTSWAEHLQLLHFSWFRDPEIQASELAGLRYYFEHVGLDPYHLAHRERPIAFVDLVASGSTFGNLISFLYQWTGQSGEDWEAVKRKIRLIGLIRRTKTSPHTWRWQQHVAWKNLLLPQAIKNVPIPELLWFYFGNLQKKTTKSYTHSRWGSSEAAQPDYDEEHLRALRLAVQCFDWGRDKQRRRAFARCLSSERAMISPWFRALVREVKR